MFSSVCGRPLELVGESTESGSPPKKFLVFLSPVLNIGERINFQTHGLFRDLVS